MSQNDHWFRRLRKMGLAWTKGVGARENLFQGYVKRFKTSSVTTRMPILAGNYFDISYFESKQASLKVVQYPLKESQPLSRERL